MSLTFKKSLEKKYTGAHCDCSFKDLEGTIIPTLDNVTLGVRKFFRKMRDYMYACIQSRFNCLEKAVKKYKSHQKVYEHQ